jgi:hypothetical protein
MRRYSWCLFICLAIAAAGCGGVEPGVATGEETTEPAQTEEVMANEAEAAKNAASQNE